MSGAMTVTLDPESNDSPDLEGCQHGSAHCHSRRSSKQPDSRTEAGRIRACHRPAGWGTDHAGEGRCKLHGGSTKKYAKHIEAERARAAVVTYGLPLDIDPTTALLREVQRTAGHVEWLSRKVQELPESDLVWGVAEETTNWVRDPDSENEQVHSADQVVKKRAEQNAWLKLYREERRHLAQVSKDAIMAGVSERIVNVFRQVGQTYIQLLDRVHDQLQLTPEQRAMLPAIMTRELTALVNEDGVYEVETDG